MIEDNKMPFVELFTRVLNTQQATSTTFSWCYSKSCMIFDLFFESPCDLKFTYIHEHVTGNQRHLSH